MFSFLSFASCQPVETTNLLSVSVGLPVLQVLYEWEPTVRGLGVWPLALSGAILRLSLVICISTLFLFMVKLYCIVWVGHTLFIRSPADEHVGVFHLVLLVNNAVRDVCGSVRRLWVTGKLVKDACVQTFVWSRAFISLGRTSWSGTAFLCGTSVFTVRGAARLLPTAAAPLYVPTSTVWGSSFSTSSLHLLFFIF